MRQSSRESLAGILCTVALIIGMLGYWFISSYFEARAFNRITGSGVSTWEAMFVELRVQESSKD